MVRCIRTAIMELTLPTAARASVRYTWSTVALSWHPSVQVALRRSVPRRRMDGRESRIHVQRRHNGTASPL